MNIICMKKGDRMKTTKKKMLSLLMTVIMLITVFVSAVPAMAAESTDLPEGATIRFEMDDGTVVSKYEFKEESYTPAAELGITGGYEENDPGYVTPLHMLAQAMIDNGIPVDIQVTSLGWVQECNGIGADIMYYVNGADSSDLFGSYRVQDGDNIVVIQCNADSGAYTAFGYFGEVVEDTFSPIEMTEEATVKTGEDLTLKYAYKGWNTGNDVAVGADVYVSEKNGDVADQETGIKTDENGEFSVSFDEAGTYIVSARAYSGGGRLASNPYCKVTVTEDAPKVYPVEESAFDWSQFLGHSDLPGVSYAKTPTGQDTIAERWKINAVDLLGDEVSSSTWNRVPGTPIIAGDYVFVYMDQRIWKIDLNTGEAVDSARVYGETINQFFIGLAYGDGKLFMPCNKDSIGDTGLTGTFIRVFDADTMEQLYVTDSIPGSDMQTYIMYHDGYITAATFGNGSYACFDTVDEDPEKSNEIKKALWTKTGTELNEGTSFEGKSARFSWNSPAFVGDCIYFGNNAQSIIYAVNYKTGEVVDTLETDGVNKATPYYCDENDVLYISHNAVGENGSCAGITAIQLNEDGSFNEETRREWKSDWSGGGTQASPVVYNGRIYLGGGGGTMGSSEPFTVIDAETMTTVYTIEDLQTKGSAAVSTAYATAENQNQVYIYAVPYNGNSQQMWLIRDHAGQTEPDYEILTGIGEPQYCSQSIEIAEDGSLIWYNDAGYVYCYENTGETEFTGAEIQSRIDALPESGDYHSYFYPSEIAQIQARYDALSEEEKAAVDVDALTWMAGVAGMDAAEKIEAQIAALPEASELTTGDVKAVLEAISAYELLNEDEKAQVSNADKLQAAEERLPEIMVPPYTDVSQEEWYYPAANALYWADIMTGMDETTFGGGLPMCRAQFVTVLYRIAGCPETEYSGAFADVPENEWYAEAVEWANENGIATGYSNGLFGPADDVNREQMATMMWRMAKVQGVDTTVTTGLESFPDYTSVSDFAEEAMEWCFQNQIITGMGTDGSLNPQGWAMRAHCAAVVLRYLENCFL